MPLLKEILLVEDDERDAELAVLALEKYNLANRIIIARDGEEAFGYLSQIGNPEGNPQSNPAVVLLDIKLPGMSGLDILKYMKENPALKDIPVVMLSASREEPDLDQSYSLGAHAYVVKPLDFHELIEATKKAGIKWGLLNE
ncbi:MAG: response regulator [Verrucomicrobia bacterium]|nr:response regulator [Verrucomicrobiota bacterium]MCF7707455.1 response regulator [Verrucomicrobiota bacterium]